MEIKYENIVLRDMVESDIEDYVRWFTAETEWSDWDAPWEPIESDAETERKACRECYEAIKNMPEKPMRWKFEVEYEGKHVGWVGSYLVDENFEGITLAAVKDGQTVYRAVGIDICETEARGKGVGSNALRAFINYYFRYGFENIYTQTWSGNTRMIRCAEKLGFVECCRCVGEREVNGRLYDGLTLRLERRNASTGRN